MGVTIATHRVALNTSTGTQNITTTKLGSLTPKAAIFMVGYATSDTTVTSHAVVSYGMATGASNEWVISYTDEDAQADSDTDRTYELDHCILLRNPGAQTVDGSAYFNSWLTNGVQIYIDDAPASAYLLTVMFFAGTDVSAYAGSVTTADVQDGSVDVTAPGFEPDIVLCSAQREYSGRDTVHAAPILGYAINDSPVREACISEYWLNNKATTECAGNLTSNYCSAIISGTNGAIQRAYQIDTFDSSGFTVWTRITQSYDDELLYLALSFNSAVSVEAVQWAEGSTGSGSKSCTSIGFKPQAVFSITTIMNVLDSGTNSWISSGFGLAAWDATDQYHTAWTSCDAQPDSVSKSISSDQAIYHPNAAHSYTHNAELTSFDANGFTLNYAACSDTSYDLIIAIEEEAAPAGNPLIARPKIIYLPRPSGLFDI